MRELKLKKCLKCGALVRVIEDCNCKDCGIECCGNAMNEVKANSVDAAFEKHVPTYEKKDGKLIVTVNHVMESEHYIEWICLLTKNKEEYRYFDSSDSCTCEFEDTLDGVLYSYCNKHGLWSVKIK